ncbi:helix-turn-helix transcriptional regulator [Bacillus sp. WMMC1349]|uniref:helix-turn-helix domain-containing protein n=1 Tax=Bacillus sp. WMMC1349 TaxID=2736254 RepID=UPI00155265A9|nr:helix-turn-helix transcriptional regulator [Bacillus sp. WMMC1349]NPC93600.1 helix-turn-helix transcriptional regulator [Bacillus sp. WMMC1349]
MIVKLKLAELLDRKNMTQKELAELTGIRPSAISEMYRGHRERVQLDHLGRIATALNITDIRELIDLVKDADE